MKNHWIGLPIELRSQKKNQEQFWGDFGSTSQRIGQQLIPHSGKPIPQLAFKNELLRFSGKSVVKNPPANTGDTSSIPGLGRSHMPQSD